MSEIQSPSHPIGLTLTDSSEGIKVSGINIRQWQDAVGTTQSKLKDAAGMLSSMEKAIAESMDKGLIEETYTGLLSTMDEISKLGKQLSKMKWSDMPKIGVKKEARVVPVGPLRQRMLVNRSTDPSYIDAVNTIVKKVQSDSGEWYDVLNWSREAAARILADICILGVLKLIRLIPFHASGPGKAIVLPELVLSSGSDEPEVFADKNLDQLTALSGITDYGVAYVPMWKDLDAPQQSSVTGVFKELSGLKSDRSSLEVADDAANFTFTLIEAKRLGTEGKKLVDALPQVIAQSMIT
ncbi:hypothetical protein M407DRAFT_21636 [Tulasnella calospora MUT 4182]|uniref:Uncharacterized protein n=1 Tax=Tulasnella calospora MUT 4182 TaxID=1051891 RepID=A0A0C3QMT0_9AGAM|nr:hypothetical protein M407DRAFT_21636 [Tulasnella calospora MUT 4182]